MAGLIIPTVTHTFNVYKSGNILIGLSEEITLPDFEAMTDTMSGSGLLGEISETVIGHFSSQEMEIPFRNLDDDIFSFVDPTQIIDLNMRAAQQTLDKVDGRAGYRGLRMATRGKLKKFKPGVLKQAGQMGASVTLELLYLLVEIDGKIQLELDKLNSVFKANGEDLLKKIKQY